MSGPRNTIERAYDLASSGACRDVSEIRRRLTEERCENVSTQISGPALLGALRRLCLEARSASLARP